MLKLAIILAIVTLCYAQDELETTKTPLPQENEIVKTLNLSNMNITSLKDYNFTNYDQLEDLDLSNNNIEYIHEETFDKNKKLKTLNLSGNKNLLLPKFSFFIHSELETLNVSNCNIKEIAQNTFDGLLNMRTLDISHNPLKANGINVFALTTTTNLRKLITPHLDGHTMMEICSEVDIVIEMRYANTNFTVTCEEVRAGSWVEPVKESELPQEVEETTEQQTETPSLELLTTAAPVILTFGSDALNPEEGIIDNSTIKEIEPVTIIQNESVTEKSLTEEEKQTNTTDEKLVETIPMQRNLNGNDSSINDSVKSSNELVKTSQSTQGSDTGTNVLIFLVVAVVVCGIGAFVYKYYKSKQTQACEPVEKELQEITINTHIKPDDTIEEEPLMNQRRNSVEIKEIDETPIQQNGKELPSSKNTSYIPITSVEKQN